MIKNLPTGEILVFTVGRPMTMCHRGHVRESVSVRFLCGSTGFRLDSATRQLSENRQKKDEGELVRMLQTLLVQHTEAHQDQDRPNAEEEMSKPFTCGECPHYRDCPRPRKDYTYAHAPECPARASERELLMVLEEIEKKAAQYEANISAVHAKRFSQIFELANKAIKAKGKG